MSDLKREITQRYNVLTPDGVALRGLFIIDKEVRSSSRPAKPLKCNVVHVWSLQNAKLDL